MPENLARVTSGERQPMQLLRGKELFGLHETFTDDSKAVFKSRRA